MASIHSPTTANLRLLAVALRRGELVAIPTETVYGLAANALDARACRKIFRAKRRPAGDPLIVHVLDAAHAAPLAHLPPEAIRLARYFWPGPLTLVVKKKSTVPDVVTAGRDSVALRSPAHSLTRRLLRLAGMPLAAPSANPFGYVSPTTAEHVRQSLGRRIRYILDGGPCRVGVESTILDLRHPARPRILRPGAITAAALARVLGRKVTAGRIRRETRPQPARGAIAPGLMKQHYSPRTPLELAGSKVGMAMRNIPADTAVIFWRRPPEVFSPDRTYWLSERGSLPEAARKLYAVLRRADQGGHARLVAETIPAAAGNLAGVINDRLRRAAARP